MLPSKNAKICVTRNAKAKICITPNANRWNIGHVGCPTQNSRVGNVHFMLFVSISFASGCQCKCSFRWNMGFSLSTLALLQCLIKLLGCNQKVGEICVMYHGGISARFKKGLFEAC